MNAKIKIDNVISTGLVEFELPFDRGNGKVVKEKIYFNPNDTDFYIRLQNMTKKVSEHWEEAQAQFDKTEDMIEQLDITDKLNKKIKGEFDIGFGNDVSGGIFKYVSPTSLVGGYMPYPFYILEYLVPLIEKETGKAAEGAKSALDKAMAKHGVNYQHKLK